MRTIPVLLIVFFSVSIFGQNDANVQRVTTCVGTINIGQPETIIIIDTLKIKLDSISINGIEPRWIKKIEVIKEQNDIDTFESKTNCVLIYPKKRYHNRILKILGRR